MIATPLRPLDIAAVLAYLLGMAAVGLYFARRNTSTEEYFVGNRSFKGWVIGLSMLGTTVSSVTFLAFPGDAYGSDWRNLVSNLTLPLVAIFAIALFIPFFRHGNLTSAFEYLEQRYGPIVRFYGVASFIVVQLIRLARILFLVSLPVALLTGASLSTVIVCTGIFIAFYTIAGGIEAVIWTDVVQSLVLLAGGLFCVAFIAISLPGGIPQIFEVASAHNKFNMGGLNPESEDATANPRQTSDPGSRVEPPRRDESLHDKIAFFLSRKTLLVVALLGIFEWLTTYACDQTVVQRYAAAKSMREARKATALFSVLALPTWVLFFFVGTCVYVYYQAFPDPTVAALGEVDAVFPHFILTQLPAGIAGLVIAGVLAAAMSSLDSSINSIATVTIVDLLKPYLAKGRDDRFYLRMARLTATLAAAFMIVGAVVLVYIPKESMNSLTWIVSSVFGGCLVGLFMLGFFTTRVDYVSVVIALVPSVALNVYFMLNVSGWLPAGLRVGIHEYWVTILVNLLFVTLAYAVSLVRRGKPPPSGLTVWTTGPQAEQP